MPQASANNITMNYDQQGTGEPLILIPYLAADHACYAFQVPEYARHFTCISVDLRGTGESDKPQGTYTTEQLADDVAAFMQATGIGKAHVSGLSLGGAIRPVAGCEIPGQSRVLVAAQQLGQKRRLPTHGRRKLAGLGEGCRRPRDDRFERFSRGASRRSCMPNGQTTSTRWRRSSAAGRRSQCRTSSNSRMLFSLTTWKHTSGELPRRRRSRSGATIS